MGIKAEIKALEQRKKDIIYILSLKILSLPENPNITKLSQNTFTLQLRHLQVASWSPKFYNFKWQYELIVERMKSSRDFVKVLEEIMDTHRVKIDSNNFEAIHPDVIKFLENDIRPLL